MNLNLCVASSISEKAFIDRIKFLDEAVIVIDENFRIISKNRPVTRLFINLRRNCKINRFLRDDHKEKIANMKKGQIIQVCLSAKNKSYNASVICGDGFKVITILPLYGDACESINRIYKKSSGYDVDINMPDDLGDFKIENKAKEILSFADFNDLQKENTIFSPSEILNCISSGICDFRLDFSVVNSEGVIYGSKYDFAMIISYLISFFIETSSKQKIEISHNRSDKNAVTTISGNSYITEEEINELFNNTPNKNSSFGYWFRILTLLSEGNLWKFSYNFSQDGRLSFCLEAPIEEAFEKCVLRDIDKEYIIKIINFVFKKKVS